MLCDEDLYPMAVFWNSYLSMLQMLCDFMKFISLGNWDLHLHVTEQMLTWFHAYNNNNYASHFTYYWASQQALSETHPEILKEFKQGGFSVRQSRGKFNKVAADQVIEQTINKDQKGPGGIISFFFLWGYHSTMGAYKSCGCKSSQSVGRNCWYKAKLFKTKRAAVKTCSARRRGSHQVLKPSSINGHPFSVVPTILWCLYRLVSLPLRM